MEIRFLLLKMLKSALAGENISFTADDRLLKLAEYHSVLNTIYPLLDKTSAEKIKGWYAAFVNQQVLLEYYGEQILLKLDEKQIRHMPLKGYYLKKLYPDPLLRSSCDLDIFFDKTQTSAVHAVMTDLGFARKSDGENHLLYQLHDTVTVEMHHDLLENDPERAHYYDNIWERLIRRDGFLCEFSDEDFYIFLLLHMFKHFMHGGFGVRSVMDIYIYNNKKTLERTYIDGEFDKLGIKGFACAVEKLAYCWFGGEESDELTDRLADFIFGSGVYGNIKNYTLTNLEKEKGNKFKYFFLRAFPPLSEMKKIYPSLKKCVLHLPFLYIHRLFRAIFTNGGKVKSELKNIRGASDDSRNSIKQLFDDLGIKNS